MKKLAALLTSLAVLSCTTAPLAANAKEKFTIQTDTFQYTYPMQLKTDLIDLPETSYSKDGVVMVVGQEFTKDLDGNPHSVYILYEFNGTSANLYNVPEDTMLKVGDLFQCDTSNWWEELGAVADYTKCEYLGNALEIFGDDFQMVLRRELRILNELNYTVQVKDNPFFDTLDFHYGDLTFDDTSSIMDVIALNRYLLGSDYLPTYSQITADTDQNGKLDETDSLNLLKYVVEAIDALPTN